MLRGMFGLARVILPFDHADPAEAIRTSLARFQRGGFGVLPGAWLAFVDESEYLRAAHEARLTFTLVDKGGLQIEGHDAAYMCLDVRKITAEMRRLDLRRWRVRFSDTMDLATFHERFADNVPRDPATGGYGRWLNPLGRWDWWDLGGRFDGWIIGEPDRSQGRPASRISSGDNAGRRVLANVQDALGEALGQEAPAVFDVRSDRNVELATTLLADMRASADVAPVTGGAVVLPPGSVEDACRWVTDWPTLGPAAALTCLGLDPDASLRAVLEAAYARFKDHWVAGVAYHC